MALGGAESEEAAAVDSAGTEVKWDVVPTDEAVVVVELAEKLEDMLVTAALVGELMVDVVVCLALDSVMVLVRVDVQVVVLCSARARAGRAAARSVETFIAPEFLRLEGAA